MSEKTLGQIAFEAYCEAVGGETFDGKPIPGWTELHGDRLKVQGGWEAAAAAVMEQIEVKAGNVRMGPSRWYPVDAPPQPEPLDDPDVPAGAKVNAERAAAAKASVRVQTPGSGGGVTG